MQLILVKSYSPSRIEMWLNGKCCRPSKIYCLNLITQAWVKWQMHSYTKACGSFFTKSYFFIVYNNLRTYMNNEHHLFFPQYVIILKETKIQVLGFNRLLTYNFLNIKFLFPIFFGGGVEVKISNQFQIISQKHFFLKQPI